MWPPRRMRHLLRRASSCRRFSRRLRDVSAWAAAMNPETCKAAETREWADLPWGRGCTRGEGLPFPREVGQDAALSGALAASGPQRRGRKPRRGAGVVAWGAGDRRGAACARVEGARRKGCWTCSRNFPGAGGGRLSFIPSANGPPRSVGGRACAGDRRMPRPAAPLSPTARGPASSRAAPRPRGAPAVPARPRPYLRAPSRPHPTAPAHPRLARTPGDLQEVGPTSRAAAVSPFRGVGPRRRWLPPGVGPAGEGGGRRRAPAHWPPGATPAGSRGSRTQGQGASSDPRAWWVGAAARGPGARGPGAGDMGMVRWSPCSLPRVSLLE